MTKPTGENDMPPAFYGRRKSDPKPIRFKEPRAFWERAPVIVGAALIFVCVLAVFLSGCEGNHECDGIVVTDKFTGNTMAFRSRDLTPHDNWKILGGNPYENAYTKESR